MSLLRVRRAAQLTLPVEIRRALDVKEGDYLEARITKDGVLLKPVSMVERKRAWEGIKDAVSRVRDLKPDPGEDMTKKEKDIAKAVKNYRHRLSSPGRPAGP